MTLGSILAAFFVGAVLLVWLGIFGTITVLSFGDRGFKRVCGVAGGVLTLYGVLGFMGVGSGIAKLVPPGVEWPMGWGADVVTTPSGMHVAAHGASGRVQVYDADWRFVRGWTIDTAGGAFDRLKAFPDETVQVWTVRTRTRYVFDLQGNRVHRPDTAGGSAAVAPSRSGMTLGPYVPTWFVLLPLAHPFIAWALIPIGVLTLVAGDNLPISKRRRPAVSPK